MQQPTRTIGGRETNPETSWQLDRIPLASTAGNTFGNEIGRPCINKHLRTLHLIRAHGAPKLPQTDRVCSDCDRIDIG